MKRKIEIQAIILDRLMEYLEKGKKEINLLEELNGELSFAEIRSGVNLLSSLDYIIYNEKIPLNQGFFVKITKKGIVYYQDIFEPKIKPKSFIDLLKDFKNSLEYSKTILISLIIFFSIIFGFFYQENINNFSFFANLLKTFDNKR
jgi:preprotein translocase subunit SecY